MKSTPKNQAKSNPSAANPYWMEANDRAHLTHFRRFPSQRERLREQAMRDWYGSEAAGEMSARRRSASQIGAAVDIVVRELGLARDVLLEGLVQHWAEIVGPDVAKRSVPSEIRGNLLLVEVADSSWMYILNTQYRQPILTKIQVFSEAKLNNLRFVPQGRIRRDRNG